MNNIFQDPETFTSILMVFLIDRYTVEVLDWDLETIALQVKDDFHTDIHECVLDKIAVGQMLLNTNRFHSSLPDFILFCNVMCNESGLKESWSPADSYEMTWAVAEEKLLVNEEEEFDEEIQLYMSTVLRDEGVVTPPDSLTFIKPDLLAGPLINQVSYDPIIYEASYKEGMENSDSLQNYLSMQLEKWKAQLQDLDLKNGSIQKLFAQ